MNLFWILLFFLVSCYGENQQDDWIDPTDMLNYDAAAGRMKHQRQYHTEKTVVNGNADGQAQGTCQSDSLDCKTDTNKWKQKDRTNDLEDIWVKAESMCKECMQRLDSLKKENEELSIQKGCTPVFRRFLFKILHDAKILGLPDESQPEVHYDVELVLTKQKVEEFLRFLHDSHWDAGPLDEALGGTLVRFKHHNKEEWSWKFEDYVGTDPFTAFMISLSILCIVMVVATELWTKIGWFTQIKRLLVLSFLVSIVWNWMFLYRDAFAERQAKLTKIGDSDACGKRLTLSESFFAWWRSSSSFQNDPCEEYFKALLVNPIFMVPPTKAFAVTFTNFITEPLKHIGIGLGEFFHGLLAEMPLFYQPMVLIIIGLLLLVFCYGFGTNFYRMSLLRRHDDRDGRLPPPNQYREGYFIEGRDGPLRNPQQIQPRRDENPENVADRRPEVLNALDGVDINNGQQDVKNPPEPLQSKADLLDQEHCSQQPAQELLDDSPIDVQGDWEESSDDSEPFVKISPVPEDVASSHSEDKENLLPDVEMVNTNQITEVKESQVTEEVKESQVTEEVKESQVIEVKEREESVEKENGQQQRKENEDEPKVLFENIPVETIQSTENVGVQDNASQPDESKLTYSDLNEEDLYTDPGKCQPLVFT